MERISRKITLVGIVLALSLVGITLFTYRKPIIESYWIHQLKNENNRIAASERLAELKSYRAIPKIVQAFEEMIKEDEDLFVGQSVVHVFESRKSSKPDYDLKVHPMLFAIYQMGQGGIENLKQAKLEYRKRTKTLEKYNVKDELKFVHTGKYDKELALYDTLISILKYINNQGTNVKVSKGPEKMSQLQQQILIID